ncbi:MAG: chemotaxis protein CheA [Candidatus Krumholzibacteriota bacterium]|nr:chemotaxis protein CheA [Candidatus Krumholzibacteriota bacterium]
MKVDDYKALFTTEADDILTHLENGVMGLECGGDLPGQVEELFRHAHNLKGMSGAMGYDTVVEASHGLENILQRYRDDVSVGPCDDADCLLKAVDLLKDLVRCAVEESDAGRGNELLGLFVESLRPVAERLDGFVRREPPDSPPACLDMDPGNRPAEEAAEEKTEPEETAMRCRPKVTSTRVRLESLDRMMDLVGELIISRIRLHGLAREMGSKQLLDELAASGRLISQIQKEVMEARLVPVGEVFQRFKRLVRDMSHDLNKKITLELVGEEIGLDRTVLESMVDPLVHLIRNAIDHGIESPAERTAGGKPAGATIRLSARRERNFVVLEVADDGRGIDREKVRRRGEEMGLVRGEMTDEEICRVISAPGLSTTETVGRFSGRGVGMSAVKKKVDAIGGSMRLVSRVGGGTVVTLHLPVNLSIIKALLFNVGEDVHAMPIEYIRETTRVEIGSFRRLHGREVFLTGGEPIPVVRPEILFGMAPEPEGTRFIKLIVIESGERAIGLVVNRILGQQDIVIKGLPAMIRGVAGISGATILGSGKIAFIWDPNIFIKGRCMHEPDQETVVSAD